MSNQHRSLPRQMEISLSDTLGELQRMYITLDMLRHGMVEPYNRAHLDVWETFVNFGLESECERLKRLCHDLAETFGMPLNELDF